MTILPNSVNPLNLPSVPLEERSNLPITPCIYFAINSQGVIQYIGRSKNPRQRWKGHDKGIELACKGGIRIAFLEITEIDLLPENERLRRKRTEYHFAPLARFAARLRSTAPLGRCGF